jgi:predicted esterase
MAATENRRNWGSLAIGAVKVLRDDVQVLALVARGLLQGSGKKTGDAPSQLAAESWRAWWKQDYVSAYRGLVRLILSAGGQELTEANDVAAAYDFSVAPYIATEAGVFVARLEPLYLLPESLDGRFAASLSLSGAALGAPRTLPPVQLAGRECHSFPISTADLPDGRYEISYQLKDRDDRSIVSHSKSVYIDRGLRARIDAVSGRLPSVSGKRDSGVRYAVALETVEYLENALRDAMTEYVPNLSATLRPMTQRLRGRLASRAEAAPLDPAPECAFAESLLNDLAANRDPFEARTGALRLAYKSPVDHSLQPFRLFVPESGAGRFENRLIVALHGATQDENSYMDGYTGPAGVNLFRALGERHGFLLVCPRGRDPFSAYRGAAEQDVLDVAERVGQIWNVPASRRFLTGHSMGGNGTWLIGFRHSAAFGALAPVAGAPANPGEIPFENAPQKPVFFAAAGRDVMVLPESTRALAEIAKKKLVRFTYREYPYLDHLAVGTASLPAVFDFFAGFSNE